MADAELADSGAAVARPGLVSCLCVTENRPGFLPWLLWNFARQSWPEKELVIVDSSREPFVGPQGGIRVVVVPEGTGIAEKRNRALAEARGEFIAWFDDDDWQHPERLTRLMAHMTDGRVHRSTAAVAEPETGVDVAGATCGWFLDLWKNRCAPYRPTGHLIFNSCLVRASVARSVSFDERVRRASDTPWMLSLVQRTAGRIAVIPRETYCSWLCHDGNVSNPSGQRRCVLPLRVLAEFVGHEAWGNTDFELDQLRARLTRSA